MNKGRTTARDWRALAAASLLLRRAASARGVEADHDLAHHVVDRAGELIYPYCEARK